MKNSNATTLCLLAASAILLSASTCRKPSNPGNDCDGVMCTMQFVMITVSVEDTSGNPITLDSAKTIGPNGAVIANGSHIGNGMYTMVDDSYQKALALKTESVVFRGFKGGRQVVEQDYLIAADCCHVSRKSGPEVVVIK